MQSKTVLDGEISVEQILALLQLGRTEEEIAELIERAESDAGRQNMDTTELEKGLASKITRLLTRHKVRLVDGKLQIGGKVDADQAKSDFWSLGPNWQGTWRWMWSPRS